MMKVFECAWTEQLGLNGLGTWHEKSQPSMDMTELKRGKRERGKGDTEGASNNLGVHSLGASPSSPLPMPIAKKSLPWERPSMA